MGYKKANEVSERKRVIKIIVKFLGVISLLVVALVGYGVYWAFFDMKRLPEGEFLTEERSPNGEYTLKAYVTNGGATTPYSVRGELVFNGKKNKTKNIYWDSREENAEIAWKGNHTVVINGHALDVRKDKYDFRRR